MLTVCGVDTLSGRAKGGGGGLNMKRKMTSTTVPSCLINPTFNIYERCNPYPADW